jgi:ABC-2 type transport system permease protein
VCDADDRPDPAFRRLLAGGLFRGADISLVSRPMVAMLIIGAGYFGIAQARFLRVIFGG